ncbi:MAG: hypothetical protein NC355_08640 [Blautia sp.]|nr:hypothetical protein [Blautia sp.]
MKSIRKKPNRGFQNFGFVTILTTFVMLCIITFSVLAVLTAHADYKLSRKVAERTSAYYEAEETAYAHLARIDAQLAEDIPPGTTEKAFRKKAEEILASYARQAPELGMELSHGEKQLYATYRIPVTETQNLVVELELLSPDMNGGVYFQLTRWQTENAVSHQIEEPPMKLIGT